LSKINVNVWTSHGNFGEWKDIKIRLLKYCNRSALFALHNHKPS